MTRVLRGYSKSELERVVEATVLAKIQAEGALGDLRRRVLLFVTLGCATGIAVGFMVGRLW
jgi:hypothetical protein